MHKRASQLITMVGTAITYSIRSEKNGRMLKFGCGNNSNSQLDPPILGKDDHGDLLADIIYISIQDKHFG